jgi:hypothetical protein
MTLLCSSAPTQMAERESSPTQAGANPGPSATKLSTDNPDESLIDGGFSPATRAAVKYLNMDRMVSLHLSAIPQAIIRRPLIAPCSPSHWLRRCWCSLLLHCMSMLCPRKSGPSEQSMCTYQRKSMTTRLPRLRTMSLSGTRILVFARPHLGLTVTRDMWIWHRT